MTSMRSIALATCALVALVLVNCALALRSGAPSLACINMRPLHGLHQAKPASSSQFFVQQSVLSYAPGQNVTVDIMTHSSGRHFRGFMVQSYDPLSGQRIGEFVANDQAQPMGCSSATHRNNQDKSSVSIVWNPPSAETLANMEQNSSPARPMPPALSAALGSWLTGIQKRHLPPAPSTTVAPQTPLRKVRFRVTIVVSYSEFYIGFESSERKFERFDYASPPASSPSAAPSQARGMVSVAVAVSPRANTTAIAIANSKRGSQDDREVLSSEKLDRRRADEQLDSNPNNLSPNSI